MTALLNVAMEQLKRQETDAHTATAVDRAVEVLSCLVTRTAVKDELMYGSPRCVPCLPLLLPKVSGCTEGGKVYCPQRNPSSIT